MVHRAPVIREPSPLRRLGFWLLVFAVLAGSASVIYVLASLAACGHVRW